MAVKQPKSLGDFLRKMREIKKLQQKDISRKMGIHPSIICRYEGNQSRPSLKMITRLIGAYQLNGGEEDEFRAILNLHDLRTVKEPREIQILSQLLMLPEDVRKRVIQAAVAYDSPTNK